MDFDVEHRQGSARTGRIAFVRGLVDTPAFMPVGTRGTIKAMRPDQVVETGAQIVLSNTFHLLLRPGMEVIKAHGGLHAFMGWQGPILTDSGGFQVFSLRTLREVSEAGVRFRSPIDGRELFLGPEESIAAQKTLGGDVVMVFDECTSYPATATEACRSMELSLRWARRCKAAHNDSAAALFGIVQGGMYPDLRAASLEGLTELGFDGYALGGLSVGESKAEMLEILAALATRLPEAAPRYLMGVGTPADLFAAVRCGIDLFDCVIPTRHARHGHLFTRSGVIRLRNIGRALDTNPADPACRCYTCRNFSISYLRHLDQCGEPLGMQLNTLHNIQYYQDLMAGMRHAIRDARLDEFGKAWRLDGRESAAGVA